MRVLRPSRREESDAAGLLKAEGQARAAVRLHRTLPEVPFIGRLSRRVGKQRGEFFSEKLSAKRKFETESRAKEIIAGTESTPRR